MKNNNKGFTLVELMVTVAIIGILAVLAMPSFTELTRNQQLKTTAGEYHATLRLARHEAMRSGRPHSACFFNNNHELFVVLGANCPDPASAAFVEKIKFVESKNRQFVIEVNADNRIIFDGKGFVQGAISEEVLICREHEEKPARKIEVLKSGLTELETLGACS